MKPKIDYETTKFDITSDTKAVIRWYLAEQHYTADELKVRVISTAYNKLNKEYFQVYIRQKVETIGVIVSISCVCLAIATYFWALLFRKEWIMQQGILGPMGIICVVLIIIAVIAYVVSYQCGEAKEQYTLRVIEAKKEVIKAILDN